jgi:hypothetical protein
MALDDYLEPEVAVAVAVTAAVASPSVRKVVRRGLVYGLAGLLIAGDQVATAAKRAAKEVQRAAGTEGETAESSESAAPAPQGAPS